MATPNSSRPARPRARPSGNLARTHPLAVVPTASGIPAETDQVGQLNIDPAQRTVYADEGSDVAVLAFEAAEARLVGRKPYHPVGNWPPPLPQEGVCVLLNGFPARLRNNLLAQRIESTSVHFTGRVARPRESQFYGMIDRDGVPTANADLMPQPGEALRGMSGGPVLMFCEVRFR